MSTSSFHFQRSVWGRGSEDSCEPPPARIPACRALASGRDAQTLVGIRVDNARFGKPAPQAFHPLPVESMLLTAPTERAIPQLHQPVVKGAQRPDVHPLTLCRF
jgi:hypothetical protein